MFILIPLNRTKIKLQNLRFIRWIIRIVIYCNTARHVKRLCNTDVHLQTAFCFAPHLLYQIKWRIKINFQRSFLIFAPRKPTGIYQGLKACQYFLDLFYAWFYITWPKETRLKFQSVYGKQKQVVEWFPPKQEVF